MYMLKYIFSFFWLGSLVLMAQQDSTFVKTDRYGLRVGADLSRLARSFYDKNYQGLEIVGDFRISKKIYLAAEIGNENKTTEDARIIFTTKGSYLKIGGDLNFYENWLDMDNQIYLGLRYAIGTFSQQLDQYRIYQTNPYLEENQWIDSDEKWDGLTAHWAEFVLGFKAETFKNLYAGFSLRLHFLVTQSQPGGFENLYIPGFNRTYNGGNFGVGFNYTLSYFIPIIKKQRTPTKVTSKI